MILKISNVRNPETFEQLYRYNPEYITINLDQSSPNYIGEIDSAILSVLPCGAKRCGLFASANTMQIISKAGRYNLDAVELISNTATPTLCEQLTAEGIEVIKTITDEQFHNIQKFEGLCNKYVFKDVLVEQIKAYKGHTPILMSVDKKQFDKVGKELEMCDLEKLFVGKPIIGYDINFNE